ncbi:MAG: DUF2256 domain-containing protein [Verrucomicrobia bacterium]|nr:DUF2256 domain-containing protein [Verrucomicrobiota bacterium]
MAKADLPRKICLHCGRPFAWRKKWERVWEEVRYCSDACRRKVTFRRGKLPPRSGSKFAQLENTDPDTD